MSLFGKSMIKNNIKVLIIEDNAALVANLFDYFESIGYIMDAAPDGMTGLHLATRNNYDVILLDLMIPGIDGIEVCRRLRNEYRNETPIIFLTAKGTLTDKIEGFDTGGDDYVVKPVELPELERRIKAQVKRTQNYSTYANIITYSDLTYNKDSLEVKRGDKLIQLNPVCRKILEVLIRNAPNVVTRESLEKEIWNEDPPDNDVLRSHIYLLRNAIDKPFTNKLIKTVQRTGYKLLKDD